MAPLPDAAKVLRGAWQTTVEGQPNLNIFHLKYSGAGANQTDLDSITSQWAAIIAGFLHPQQHVDTLDVDLTVIDLTSHTALTSHLAQTGAGTHSGGASTASIACCVSWHVHRRYRGGHPRTYIGGIPLTGLATERSFATAYVNAVQAAAGGYITNTLSITAGAYGVTTPVSLSYFNGGALRVTPVTDDIIGSSVNARPDSQRRRLGRVAG